MAVRCTPILLVPLVALSAVLLLAAPYPDLHYTKYRSPRVALRLVAPSASLLFPLPAIPFLPLVRPVVSLALPPVRIARLAIAPTGRQLPTCTHCTFPRRLSHAIIALSI